MKVEQLCPFGKGSSEQWRVLKLFFYKLFFALERIGTLNKRQNDCEPVFFTRKY